MHRKFIIGGRECTVHIVSQEKDTIEFIMEEKTYIFHVDDTGGGYFRLKGEKKKAARGFIGKKDAQQYHVFTGGYDMVLEVPSRLQRKTGQQTGKGSLTAPMPGKILSVAVKEGQKVKEGQALMVMEAMKLQHTIKASHAGRVEKIFYKEQDQVSEGTLLLQIKADKE